MSRRQVVGLRVVDPFLQLVLDLAVEQPRDSRVACNRTVVVEPGTDEQLEQLLDRSARTSPAVMQEGVRITFGRPGEVLRQIVLDTAERG
jgi:hypothetical protein